MGTTDVESQRGSLSEERSNITVIHSAWSLGLFTLAAGLNLLKTFEISLTDGPYLMVTPWLGKWQGINSLHLKVNLVLVLSLLIW